MSYLEKPAVVGTIFISLSASMVCCAWYNRKNRRIDECRFNQIIKERDYPISQHKIILAFDPENLFVNFSERKKEGYKLLKEQSDGLSSMFFKKFSNRAHCYRQKASSKSIRAFLRRLKQIPHIEVVLYTGIQEQYWIDHLFPHQLKYFMKNKQKSPEEVDCDTGRVIIITANHEDQRDGIMGSHHNLILSLEPEEIEENLLVRLQHYLVQLTRHGRTDSLHEEMHDLALQMGIPLYNYQSKFL